MLAFRNARLGRSSQLALVYISYNLSNGAAGNESDESRPERSRNNHGAHAHVVGGAQIALDARENEQRYQAANQVPFEPSHVEIPLLRMSGAGLHFGSSPCPPRSLGAWRIVAPKVSSVSQHEHDQGKDTPGGNPEKEPDD